MKARIGSPTFIGAVFLAAGGGGGNQLLGGICMMIFVYFLYSAFRDGWRQG